MAVFPVLAVGFVMSVVGVLFVVCAVALILVILIQKGRGGGLSAAFGGGMAGGLLGSKTGDFLTWVTIMLAGVFLLLAIVMGKFYKPTVTDFGEGSAGRPPAAREGARTAEPPPEDSETATSDSGQETDINSPGVR
ncbi:MAG: preprotein translocase subunit SecG [Planctomycetota bacterium]|jgi:preprotein translocase subunit SecG